MFYASYDDSKQKLTRVRLEFMTHVLHMVIRLLQLGNPIQPAANLFKKEASE